MNPLPENDKTGKLGELLVQLRLLEHDVQAAPPLKDSGNDLIAVKGRVIKAIQVKTSIERVTIRRGELPDEYDILALVQLVRDGMTLLLDASPIFLVSRDQIQRRDLGPGDLRANTMTEERVAKLFDGGE